MIMLKLLHLKQYSCHFVRLDQHVSQQFNVLYLGSQSTTDVLNILDECVLVGLKHMVLQVFFTIVIIDMYQLLFLKSN